MQQVTPADTTVARLCRELGFMLNDDRVARELGRDDAAEILETSAARHETRRSEIARRDRADGIWQKLLLRVQHRDRADAGCRDPVCR